MDPIRTRLEGAQPQDLLDYLSEDLGSSGSCDRALRTIELAE